MFIHTCNFVNYALLAKFFIVSDLRIVLQCSMLSLFMLGASCAQKPLTDNYFEIQIIDSETRRGIPLVELSTLSKVSYITDSQGYIAFYEPGLMEGKLYFLVECEGYLYPKDMTGRSALSLNISAGGSAVVEMRRIQAAERLYRTTGQGIYRSSYLLGHNMPIEKPLLNARVLGQDSNIGARYKGKIFWIWGDTFLPSQYNGNFSVAAATSLLPDAGGLDPNIGINYTYFKDEHGSSKSIIALDSPGYVWYEWLMNIPDSNGNEQLVAKYSRVGGQWQNYERGVALFNDKTEMFEKLNDSKDWLSGYSIMHHPFKGRTKEQSHYYVTSGFEMSRVPLDINLVGEPSAYESFTCLPLGSKYDSDNLQLDRNTEGKLNYGWKKNTDVINMQRQNELIKKGLLKQEEGWIQLINLTTHEPMTVARGSIFWNEYRQKWILIAGGSGDYNGDILYSEADTPVGPWGYACIVAQHDNMLYNPTQHPFFDQDNGQIIYFEGTYANFWGQGSNKARYDYNQLMYKLDLSRQATMLPSPVYRLDNGNLMFGAEIRASEKWAQIVDIAFFAYPPDHSPSGLLPVYKTHDGIHTSLTTAASSSPFMFSLPTSIDASKKYIGQWDCSLESFEAIEAYLPLEIVASNGNLTATTKSETMTVTESQKREDKLLLTIRQYNKEYTLTASVSNGNLVGEWSASDGSYSGNWKGELIPEQWLPQFSAHLFMLKYNSENLCQVWKNPFGQPVFDWTIQPY